jgi:hypothetical protein
MTGNGDDGSTVEKPVGTPYNADNPHNYANDGV